MIKKINTWLDEAKKTSNYKESKSINELSFGGHIEEPLEQEMHPGDQGSTLLLHIQHSKNQKGQNA